MNAGRELDALIAEKVMGVVWDEWRCRICGWPLRPHFFQGCVDGDCSMRPVPVRRADEPAAYSTDIAAAWLVFNWLRAQRDIVCLAFDQRDNRWEIDACEHIDYVTGKRDDGSLPRGCAVIAHADTAPLALCRAALAALGVPI